VFEPGAVRFELRDVIEPGPGGRDTVNGITYELPSGKLVIAVSRSGCVTRSAMIETVLHELAHVALWNTGRGINHGKEFWVTYGRFIDAYHDRGVDDSKTYFVD